MVLPAGRDQVAVDQVAVAVDKVAGEQVVVAPQVVVRRRTTAGGGSARRRVGRLGCGRFRKSTHGAGSNGLVFFFLNGIASPPGPTCKLRTHFTNATRRNHFKLTVSTSP